ncbi:MAG: TMEM43 family protein, partial [Chthoniobacterales bacterium]|nr:TMEM43 family protein [Chthoniobacterales bacterium]
WKENKTSETRKKLGGGEETVTTYTYMKAWSNMLNDTANFQEPSGHENPSEFPYSSMTLDAERVAAGAFYLSPDLISQLSDFKHLPVRDEPEGSQWPEGARTDKSGIYLGANPAQPQVGDARIKFSVVEQGPVSVVAAQNGDTFADYQTKVGGAIDMIVPGNVPAQQMFEDAISNNVLLTWILRLVGFILIWIGFGLLFAPLSVLADIFPLFGSLVGAATGLIAFLLALAVALTVIAIAWVVFRPLLGVALLVVAVASAVFGFRALRKKLHAA